MLLWRVDMRGKHELNPMILSNGLEGDKAELRISGDDVLHGVSFCWEEALNGPLVLGENTCVHIETS